MIRTLIKVFFRSKGSILVLFGLLIIGLISIVIGNQYLEQNKKNIEKINDKKYKKLDKSIEYHGNDLGLFLYYQKFSLINQTENIVGLSTGLRNTNPVIKDVTIRNLEDQKYASELVNPFYQLLGNMDFNFVLTYFFPLVIIILLFNICSEERESRRWNMILIQSVAPLNVFGVKILIRYFLVIGITFIILLFGKFYLNIQFTVEFLLFVIVSILYITFWFALCSLIISFNKKSSTNLLLSLIIWISFSIIVPAIINLVTIIEFPVPEAFNTALKSREGYHEKWDMDKEPTIKRFKDEYPELSKYQHPKEKSFSWFWYYAMQNMGDIEAKDDATNLKEKLYQRDNFVNAIGMLFPPLHTHLVLNRLTNSDLVNYINYLSNLDDFHKKKRLGFYHKIFTDNIVDEKEMKNTELISYFYKSRKINVFYTILPFIVAIFILLIWSRKNFFKTTINKYN